MDQMKIGAFLKALRKEKALTQEQTAEILNVSNRTVSRWETGANLPDISLLQEIAKLYDVSISDIIDGERKTEDAGPEESSVAQKMSDYAEAEKTSILKGIAKESLIGVCALAVLAILELFALRSCSPVTEALHLYCQVFAYVSVIMVFLHASGLLRFQRTNAKEKRLPKAALLALSLPAAAAVGFVIRFLLSLISGA